MLEFLARLKDIFETFGKIKKAFESLQTSNLFVKEIDICDLIEKHFSLEQLPTKKVKVVGRLSNYTLSNNFPIYTPAHLKGIRQQVDALSRAPQLEVQATALSVPCISYNPVKLLDNTVAKILWLYPVASNGLIFSAKEKAGLVRSDICEIFGIESKDKPIPILVD